MDTYCALSRYQNMESVLEDSETNRTQFLLSRFIIDADRQLK